MPDEFTPTGFFRRQKLYRCEPNNPKQPGSMAWERFQNYFSLKNDGADTVADALHAGVRMDDISHDWRHGFIAVGDEAVAVAMKKATLPQ